jgi:recombination protein RecA
LRESALREKKGYSDMAQSTLRLVEGNGMDKSKALDAALSQIERSFGKGSIMKLGKGDALEIESVSTGSIGLDIALGIGGLPRGRMIEIYGPESSGKTTLALHSVHCRGPEGAAFAPLSMPSTRSTRSMPASWA